MNKKYADWDFYEFEANSLIMASCSEPGISEPDFYMGGDTHHLFLLDDENGEYTIMKISEVLGEKGRTDWAAVDDFVYEDEVIGSYSNFKKAIEAFEEEATMLYEEFSENSDDQVYHLKRDVKDLINQLQAEGKYTE